MKLVIFINTFLFCALATFPALALDISNFTQSEYAFSVKEPDKLEIAPDSLSDKRKAYYNFINFEAKKKEQLLIFLDTPERHLNQELLIIRVRENVTKPKKSKITVKLRSELPEHFSHLRNYNKAEIDIVNGIKKYSVSYDIKYNPNKIDIRKVDVQAVFGRIKKKNPDAWSIVESRLNGMMAKIQPTIIMRALIWKGLVANVSGNVVAEYALWSPFYKHPRVSFSSVSFKGKSADKNLDNIAKRIKDAMIKNRIFSKDTDSKTTATFKLSPNFK